MLISISRTIILYIAIILAIKLMGKRQIGEMQPSELVITLLLSDIASIPMQNNGQPLISGVVPMLVLVICEVVISVLMLKHTNFRRFVCGKPQIVILNGKVQQGQMRRLRMSIEDLIEQLRQADVFSLDDVAYAIVETNGRLSIMKKPEKNTPTIELMGITPPKDNFEVVVVNDGDFAPNSAKICNVSEQWVKNILRQQKVSIEDVFIMTVDMQQKYNVILREE